MSDKLSNLSEETVVSGTDQMYVVPSGGSSKKVTVDTLMSAYGGYPQLLHAPVDSDFAWLNQGSATIDTTGPGILMTTPTEGNNNIIRGRIKPVVSQLFTTTVLLSQVPVVATGSCATIFGVYDSGSDKLNTLYFGFNNSSCILYTHWTNASSLSTIPVYFGGTWPYMDRTWLQVILDSTNITFNYSVNGIDFIQLGQEAKNSFMPAFTHCVWGTDNSNGGVNQFTRLLSWQDVDNDI